MVQIINYMVGRPQRGVLLASLGMTLVLCRVLGANCVTRLYIDEFAPCHNRMNVNHNILSNFNKPYVYKAESARKIGYTTEFSIYRIFHMIFGVEKLIFGQKSRKKIGPSYITVKLSIYKTTSDMFRTIWAFKTRELIRNDCSAIQRYRALIRYHYSFLS